MTAHPDRGRITIRELTVSCCDECDQPADNKVTQQRGEFIRHLLLCDKHTDPWRQQQ